MEKSYQPGAIESHWYKYWEEHGCFSPGDSAQSYCIMLPPPNVTGRLHMGHAFQYTIMDILSRYHRMRGEATLWQPGTDHAGIATQMVVERQLAAEGRDRRDIGRSAFVDAVWKWKEHSGGTISNQMRQLGASVDWEHERFTLEPELSAAVSHVFVSLYEEGLIYRGKRLVNWDPVLLTALSDLEVLSEEENGQLWHIRYPREDGKGYVIVATTRPETMLGDTAVAVHPDDERYQDLVGKQLQLPLTDRRIPVVADDYVDPEFGTGCVKITPAHDFNDYEVGKRHDLPMINILNDDASLNEQVPAPYQGLDRFVARDKVVSELQQQGLIERIDEHRLVIPRGDRSGAIVEPYLTDQWYVKIGPLAQPAIEAVESGQIRFVPGNWANTYFEWMHNIQDWCISRQLWWGHRIPAWYDEDGNVYVGGDEAAVRARHELPPGMALRQDEDVLDTWFSSALWPFTTLGWPAQTERLEKFYPGNVLVTGFDIIFFWVARMIMMGLKFAGDVPFQHVYIHGLIRDSHGQKMSKSKGNVLDPIDLINGIDLENLVKKRSEGLMQPQMAPAIERVTREDFPDGIAAFGTDALRFTFSALATSGRDIRFDLGRIEGYRNFCNKLWNAARYVLMQTDGEDIAAPQSRDLAIIDRWIGSRLSETVAEVHTHIESYRFDLASQAMYEFVWNEFCDWYLELSKPALQTGPAHSQAATRYTLARVLEETLRMLHPVMPFVTEEIWQRLREPLALDGETIMLQPYPQAGESDQHANAAIQWLKGVLLEIRRIRSEQNLAPGKPLPVLFQAGTLADREHYADLGELLAKLGRIESFTWLEDDARNDHCAVALHGELRIMIPLAGLIEVDAELARLAKLLDREEAELGRSEAKLSNRQFVENAPEAVVNQERDRLKSHTARAAKLRQQLDKLRELG